MINVVAAAGLMGRVRSDSTNCARFQRSTATSAGVDRSADVNDTRCAGRHVINVVAAAGLMGRVRSDSTNCARLQGSTATFLAYFPDATAVMTVVDWTIVCPEDSARVAGTGA